MHTHATNHNTTLPPIQAANSPIETRGLRREDTRLLVSSQMGQTIEHNTVEYIADYLQPGDVVVVNDSQTIPGALPLQNLTTKTIWRLHLSQQLTTTCWIVEFRQAQGHTSTPFDGPVLNQEWTLPAGVRVHPIHAYDDHKRLWYVHIDFPEDTMTYIHNHGQPIRYNYIQQPWPLKMYQTPVGRSPGSVEMPSAARALTQGVLNNLMTKGIKVVPITLHCGVSSLERTEPPHAEYYQVSHETAQTINQARALNHRILAVGTTVLRALESSHHHGDIIASSGQTDLLFDKSSHITTIDGLLSGFHPPEASHVNVLEAIIHKCHLYRAYNAASGAYLSHEFGDLHLMWRQARATS